MKNDNISEEKKALLVKSGDMERCAQIYELSLSQCSAKNMVMTEVQQLSLLSHLSAMVNRSLTGERFTKIDRSLFSEISSESLLMAKIVKDQLENLDEDETYLLSIHFEVAKQNK